MSLAAVVAIAVGCAALSALEAIQKAVGEDELPVQTYTALEGLWPAMQMLAGPRTAIEVIHSSTEGLR